MPHQLDYMKENLNPILNYIDDSLNNFMKLSESPQLYSGFTIHFTIPKSDENKIVLKCKYKICSKTFMREEALKFHLNTFHRKFICHYLNCEKSFGAKKSLNAHIEKAHKNFIRYKCGFCYRRYTSAHSKNTHERKHHTKFLFYKCEECGNNFMTKYKYKKHLLLHKVEDSLTKDCYEIFE